MSQSLAIHYSNLETATPARVESALKDYAVGGDADGQKNALRAPHTGGDAADGRLASIAAKETLDSVTDRGDRGGGGGDVRRKLGEMAALLDEQFHAAYVVAQLNPFGLKKQLIG